jgi:hypothetical protein
MRVSAKSKYAGFLPRDEKEQTPFSQTECLIAYTTVEKYLCLKTIPHSGRDERLLVLGTQTRAPPVCLVSLIGSKYFSTVVLRPLPGKLKKEMEEVRECVNA